MAYDPERIVSIGELEKRGKTVRFGIKEKDRSRHIYVIGQTGTGKSTLLEMLAMQDIRNGTGLIFMDPHGQSVEALLQYVTRDYLDNIIYFAPHHQERPIGLNIMEDIGYDKRHLVVSSLMASFEKIWGAGTWSDRMAYILQNTLLALIEYPGTTLLDVGRMYSSKGFREKVVANLKDPQVRKYWVEEFANYTERYAQEATPSIQNKLGQFTSNPLMRNIIGQKDSAFNFREIMDEGKILLVNLSKGQIGENNARMLGVLFTTKIYLAALSRSNMTKAELEAANPCNFFVDEFQSFANSSFSDILSEARKYKLNLVMAHQYLGQLYSDDSGGGDVIRDAVFGNVGTFVSFRVGPVDAEIISKQFAPDIAEEDLVALPRYHIYLTLNIDGAGSTPFSARTFYEPAPESMSLEDEVVQRTMDVYGADRAAVEKLVEDNLAEDVQSNEAAKKSGGQKGGGKKSGWQQGGGGQRSGGQRSGGQKGAHGGDRRDQETHTPLKGLVQQMMQRPEQQKEEKSKERGDDGEGVVKKRVDASDQPRMDRSKERVGQRSESRRVLKKKMDVSERRGANEPKERVEQKGEVGKVVKKDVAMSVTDIPKKEQRVVERSEDVRVVDTPKVQHSFPEEKQRRRRGRGSEGAASEREQNDDRKRSASSGKVRREESVAMPSPNQQRTQRRSNRRDAKQDGEGSVRNRGQRQQRVVERSEDVRVVDTPKVQHSFPEEKQRRRRGRGSEGAASEREQNDDRKRSASSGKVRREEAVAMPSPNQQRTQRRSNRRDAKQDGEGSVRNRGQREKKQKNYGGGGGQRQVPIEKFVVRIEKEKGGSTGKQGVSADVKQDGARVEQQVKERRPQLTDALRRPNGVVVGTVSRSMATQQSVTEQRTEQLDVSGGQQGAQDAKQGHSGKQQQRGHAGGLGDLVKTTKASGLRKDLKVAPKKEKHAPPIRYEEGWFSIGDLARK